MRKLPTILLLWVLAPQAKGLGSLYGLEFYRYHEKQQSTETLQWQVARANRIDWNMRQRRLETDGGPYAAGLTELLFDAGRADHSAGRYGDAEEKLSQAIHLSRVNEGLYSKSQIPILRHLIMNDIDAGSRRKADQRQAYLYRLHEENYPALHPDRLRARLDYMRWLREAWLTGGDYKRLMRLLELYALGERTIEKMAEAGRAPAGWELVFIGEHMKTLTILSRLDVRAMVRSDRPVLSVSTGGESGSRSGFEFNQLLGYQKKSFSNGRALLTQLATGHPDAVERARAYAALGDWYTWNGSPIRAEKFYAQSWRELTAAGEKSLRQDWYGEPRELPLNQSYYRQRLPARDRGELTVRLQVSRRGRVQSLELLGNQTQSATFSRIEDTLRETLFRPAMRDGEVVVTPELIRRYRLDF